MTENKFDYRKILSKYSIVLVLIVIMIACTFANSSFLMVTMKAYLFNGVLVGIAAVLFRL